VGLTLEPRWQALLALLLDIKTKSELVGEVVVGCKVGGGACLLTGHDRAASAKSRQIKGLSIGPPIYYSVWRFPDTSVLR